MAARDSQRSRVYEAEQSVRTVFDRAAEFGNRTVEVYGSSLTLPVERRFAAVESVQSYVDSVLALNWVSARWPRCALPVRVRERAGAQAAHYSVADHTLAIPTARRSGSEGPWALRELVILHELAHHLDDSPSEAAHGPEFCSRYLELVDGIIGPEAALLLRSALLACAVRIN